MNEEEKYIIISGKAVPCKVIRKIRSRYLIDTGMERFTVEPGRIFSEYELARCTANRQHMSVKEHESRPDVPFWEKIPGSPGTWPH